MKCVLCWNLKNPDEEAVQKSPKEVLDQFVVCKKHKGELMSACSKCGSQSSTFKEGFSKKNGKPWKANKCDDCGEMNWIATPKSSNGNSQSNSSLEKKVDQILAILQANFKEVTVEKEESSTPF